MIALLQSSWMAALVGGLLYLGTTVVLFKPAHFANARSAASLRGPRSANDDPSWRFRNPEFDQLVEELRREKEALALKQQELQDLQTRLGAERQELFAITQMVYQIQAEFDRNVIRFKGQEAENAKRQVKVITAMSPESAAGMLAEMADDEVVKLLALMKPDEASTILQAIGKTAAGAKRAATLTDLMRRVVPPTANTKSTRAS
jgi:flagellar motility protein MotE (MotC chaperone)